MSTLNNIQSNPFVNHGEQLTTDLIEYQIINQMPRSLASPPDFDKNQTLDPNSVQNSSKKRKFHNDNEDNIFTTPVHKSHGVVITPPKSSSNKRLKTFPQSSMVSGYPSFSEIYQTPKTPTHNADYKIGDGSPIDYSISNPQHYTANFLSTRNNNFSDVDVTPPNSQSNSPNQKFAKLALPSVRLQRSTPGYHQFYYPDTCYSFNIGGGSVKPNADNTKRNVWREQCEYKLRHELNREMKEYATLTETLKQQNAKRLDESVYNPPSYNDPVLFPNMIKMNNIVSSFPEQPDIGNFKYDHQKLNEDAELLLKLRNNSKNSREKSEFMNKNSKYNNRFSLPSIKHLLNLQPIDKSCILPSVLSTSEIKQFKNTAKCGFVFDNQADFFSNGTQIKYNNPVTEQMEDLQRQRQRETDNFFNIYYQRQKLYQPQNQVFGSQYHASSIPATQNSNLHNVTESTQKPIFSVHTNISSNACDDFAKSISKDENCIETTNDIKIQPLIIPKNRKVTSKSSPKNSNKKVPAKNARSRSSSRGSKASSRSTSGSSAKSKKAASSTSKSSVTAVVNKPRTRSSTTNSTRCSSIDSTKTAELPASVHTSPKRSPVTHNNGLTDLELHHSHIYHENRFPIVLNQTQNIKPMKAQEAKVKPLKFSITSVQSNKTTVKSNSSHHVHENIVKKCVSCHSSDSPCWRPSWSKDEGQLCNSCGLRYRKTKARCCNVKCLKIPSKSEWSLMEKRGKISAHIYSKEGEISGETVGYRCLDCDSVVEVQ